MSAKYSHGARLGLTVIACAVLAACGSLDGASGRIAGIVTPYKIEIVQGNFVSKEQVEALQRGMTRAQVKEVLGTPLMTSIFHADRWDYVFTLKRQGVAPQSRKLALFFQGDQLDKWEGDTMPSEAEFVAQLDSTRKSAKVPLLEVPEEVLKEFNLKNPPAPRTEALAAAGAARVTYPPLEAPGTITQAWDASTQRAVVAAAASRPVPPPSVVQASSVAPAPLAVQTPSAAQAPSPAPVAAPTPARVQSVPAVQTPAPAPAPVAPPTPPVVAAAAVSPPAVAAAAPLPAPVAPRAAAAAPATAVAPLPAVAAAVPAATLAPSPPPKPAPAAPAVAAAVPAPAPAVPASSVFVGLDAEVSAFLNGWVSDWQSSNATAYFARYVPEFKGSSATRAEWEAARRPSIESRRSVAIAVQDVRGVMIPPTGARIVFRQIYDSDIGNEIGTKALFLVKRDGRWLIEREFFTPAVR
jgi:outer membrane protein assembly factor BamE